MRMLWRSCIYSQGLTRVSARGRPSETKRRTQRIQMCPEFYLHLIQLYVTLYSKNTHKWVVSPLQGFIATVLSHYKLVSAHGKRQWKHWKLATLLNYTSRDTSDEIFKSSDFCGKCIKAFLSSWEAVFVFTIPVWQAVPREDSVPQNGDVIYWDTSKLFWKSC